ncbi:MAG TPA: DUF3891 family protein [Planctomycetota bacterium]|jgi:hypothetical protein
MVHREDPNGLIVITQLAHAWISGQLSRAWGNSEFGLVTPQTEVNFAAEQHDLGWLEWEREPTLNPKTGRPYTFMELPVSIHTHLWGLAGPMALVQGGRYAALLVSLHGSGLYTRRERKDGDEDAKLVREFIANSRAFEAEQTALLQDDKAYVPFLAPEVLARNRRLIAVWDFLSLLLCMNLKAPRPLERVPTANGETAITVAPLNGEGTHVSLAPWPFRESSLTLVCEGRRLPETFTDEHAMRQALCAAPPVTIKFELKPA